MKSVIKYSILMICFSVSILLVMDINSISQRKSEMEDAAEISMRNSLKAVGIHKMYAVDESGMEAELLREFASISIRIRITPCELWISAGMDYWM